jgi:predicted membrane protein
VTFAPSHFTAVLIFALCASTVFGVTQRSEPRAMFRYGLYCFVLFTGAVIAASWLMFFIHR